jgi:DNA-binding transcriptional LysR family regulator
MDLRHFRYFVAVAEELHFTRAAQRLHISQPPLSKHIQEIERALGVVLLERTRRRVELTEAGRLFLVEARAVLAQTDHAIGTGRRIAKGELGKLAIGFTATAAYMHLFPRAVRAFRQELPDVNLSLSYMTTELILDAVLRGEIDLGLIRPSAMLRLPAGINAIPIVRDRLMLALHEGDAVGQAAAPVPLESLAALPFVLRPRGRGSSFYEQVYDLCGLAGFSPRLSQEANEAPTILGLVASGLGLTILPASLRAIKVPDVTWRELSVSVGTLESQVYLIHSNQHAPTPQRSRFIEIVSAGLP